MGNYLPQMAKPQLYEIILDKVGENIQYMKGHALIFMFVGIWPLKRILIWWIKKY